MTKPIRILITKCLFTDWGVDPERDMVDDTDGLVDECLFHGEILNVNIEVLSK